MGQTLKPQQLPTAWQSMVKVLDRIGHSNGQPAQNDCAMAGIYATTLTSLRTPGGKPAIDRRKR